MRIAPEWKTGAYCTKLSNWEVRMQMAWDETTNMWRLWRTFLWCFIFYLLSCIFFCSCARQKKEKIVSLKWWLVCGLDVLMTWPYSRPISQTLLQILGWTTSWSFLFIDPRTLIFLVLPNIIVRLISQRTIFSFAFFHDLRDHIVFLHEFLVKIWDVFSPCLMACQLRYSALFWENQSKLCKFLPYFVKSLYRKD